MSEMLFVTALMMWALAAMVTIAGFYLIRKINDMEKRLQEAEQTLTDMAIFPMETNEVARDDLKLNLPASVKEEIGKALIKEAEEKDV